MIRNLWAVMAIGLCGGCLAVMPGTQSAAALSEYSRVRWNKDDEIDVVNKGPQTAAWVMASGGELVFLLDGDGNLVRDDFGNPVLDLTKSRPDYFFSSTPSAEHAAAVAPTYAKESTAQLEHIVPSLFDFLTEIIKAYKDLATMQMQPTPGGDGG